MDLRSLANSVTSAVNPDEICELWRSTGSTTEASGKRVPNYAKSPIMVQIQAMSYTDLRKLDNLNIQGVRRKIYTDRQVAAIIRPKQKGGDLLVFPRGALPEGTTWLCVEVLERWTDWCTFAITLQNDDFEAFAC